MLALTSQLVFRVEGRRRPGRAVKAFTMPLDGPQKAYPKPRTGGEKPIAAGAKAAGAWEGGRVKGEIERALEGAGPTREIDDVAANEEENENEEVSSLSGMLELR